MSIRFDKQVVPMGSKLYFRKYRHLISKIEGKRLYRDSYHIVVINYGFIQEKRSVFRTSTF